MAWKDATKNVEGHAPAGFRGPWMSGKKVSASGGPKQVNQRHAAQNGRYPILSISAIQRPVSGPSNISCLYRSTSRQSYLHRRVVAGG